MNPKLDSTPVAKLLIIGDSKVGKSCILTRFTENFFTTHTATTVGIDYKTKKVKVDDVEIKLQVWDTAGQERYRSIAQNFYKNAMGVMVVFDLTDEGTFENVRNWLRQIKTHAGENVCKLLIANKADLADERAVSDDDIKQTAEDIGLQYFLCSAKSGENINEAFMSIATNIKKNFFPNAKPRNDSVKPNDGRITIKKEKDDGAVSGAGCCGKKSM